MLCCKTRHLAWPTNLTTVYGESHTVWNTMGTESKAKNMPSHLFTLQWFFCCSGNKGLICWTVFIKPLIHSLAKISRAALTPSPPQLSELKPRLPGKTRPLAKAVTSWNEAQPIIVSISISQIQQKIVRSQETQEAIGHVGAACFPLNKEQENICISSGLSTSAAAWIDFQWKYSTSLQLVVCLRVLISTKREQNNVFHDFQLRDISQTGSTLRIIIVFCSKTGERGGAHSARKHFLGAFLADTSAF